MSALVSVALAAALLFIYWLVLRRSRIELGSQLILLAAMLLYLIYLGHTRYMDRNYDAAAQLFYIEQIAKTGHLPARDDCFICHHPPLYYWLMAQPYRWLEGQGVLVATKALQGLSLCFTASYLVFGALTARRFLSRVSEQRWALLVMAFWPSTVLHSARLHNDTLFASLVVAGAFFLLRYWQERRPRDLLVASVVALAAVMTKSSAVALVGLIGVVLLSCWSRASGMARLQLALAAVVPLVLFVVLRAWLQPSGEMHSLCERVLGSACRIPEREHVPNGLGNYLCLGPGLLTEPYVSIGLPQTGVECFWSALFKSSLFATHNGPAPVDLAHPVNARAALLDSWLALGLFGASLLGLLRQPRAAWRMWLPIGVALGIAAAELLVFRGLVPAPHHNDFRHIWFVTAWFALVVGYVLGNPLALPRWAGWGARTMAVMLVLVSVVYYSPLGWPLARVLTIEHTFDCSGRENVVRNKAPPWPGFIAFAPYETLVCSDLPDTMTGYELGLEGNDAYELTIETEAGVLKQVLEAPGVHPHGLATYHWTFGAPVHGAKSLRIRPVRGDALLGLGQLILHQDAP